jgi:hypothetical protein
MENPMEISRMLSIEVFALPFNVASTSTPLLEWYADILAKIPERYRASAMFEFNNFPNELRVVVRYERPETEQENAEWLEDGRKAAERLKAMVHARRTN